MSTDERRTIEELAVRYELEPTLRDVYVEGAFDAAVVGWVLREGRCHNAAVYEIDTVNIPVAVLSQYGLDEGSKGRVIALCMELDRRVVSPQQVTGVVDRDYDTVLGRSCSSQLLLFTDYSCMEMYFFSESTLERFLHFLVRKDGGLATRLLSTLAPVLQELFFIRATNESLGLRLMWLEVEKQCSVKGGAVKFDAGAFVHKYLNKGSKVGEKDRFQAECTNLRARAVGDPKHHINGHDFIRLLAKLLHSLTRNKNLADPEVVERALTGCADYQALMKNPMLAHLLQRLSS